MNKIFTRRCTFDRKNYFYPDNPKVKFQFDEPLATMAGLEIELEDGTRKLHERGPLEEDAGKNTHGGPQPPRIPLIEIVSEADAKSEEAYAYLTASSEIIQHRHF